MKKNKIIVGLLAATIGFSSCNTNENQEAKTIEANPQEVVSTETTPVNEVSVDEINLIRTKIEALQVEPLEITTSDLREKIKQKWSKMHFYVEDGIVVKVKTYPYAEISKRTEEFYANKDGLLLVVIEDNGEGPKGKSQSEIDKMYYFNNDKLIKKIKKGEEQEFSNENLDAQGLSAEFKEYIEIYNKYKK